MGRAKAFIRPLGINDWLRALPWLILIETVFCALNLGHPGGMAGKYIWDEHCVAHCYPVAWLARQEVWSGHFPLWNPFSGCGLPLLANTLDESILPYSVLKYLFPFPLGLNLFIAAKLFLAFTGAFALSRGIGSSRPGAILAAAIYGLTGIITLNVNNTLGPVLLMPWCVFALHRLALHPRLRSSLLVTAAFGLALMGGNPQFPVMDLLIGYCLYLVILAARRTPFSIGRYALLPAFFIIAGATLASIQLLPFIEYLGRCFSHHVPGYGEVHLDPRGFIGILNPLWDPAIIKMGAAKVTSFKEIFFHDFPPANWEQATTHIPFEHAGTYAAFFIILALLTLRRITAEAAYFCAVAICSLGIGFGIFPFSLIGRVPPFTEVSNWRYIDFSLALSASVLAGMACTRLALPAFRRSAIISLAVLAAITALGMALVTAQAGLALASPLIFWPVAGTIAALGLLAAMVLIRRPWPMIVFCVVELLCWDRAADRRLFPNPLNALQHPGAVTSCAPADPGFRFTGYGETLHPSLGILLDRYDFRSYEMIFPDALVRTIAAANGWDRTRTVLFYLTHYYFTLEPRALASPFAAQASIRSLSSDDFLPPPELGPGILKNARVVAPSPAYVQPIRQEIGGVARSGWFQHAPSALMTGPGADGPRNAPAGSIAIMPRSWTEPGDGVVMQVLSAGPAGPALVYSRYLDPRREPSERRWVPLLLPAGPQGRAAFSVLPGPKNDARSDYAVWADFHDPEKRAAFERTWELEKAGKSKCFHNDAALPRLRVAQKTAVVPDLDACLDGLREREWPGGTESVVDRSGALWPAGQGRVSDEQWSADRVAATVNMESAGTLVLADTYYPGWRAAIDGVPAPIHRADCAFRAVRIPRGRHSISFTFIPSSFRIGLWCGLTSWIIFIAAVLLRRSPGGGPGL